jgi:hypothetical protein
MLDCTSRRPTDFTSRILLLHFSGSDYLHDRVPTFIGQLTLTLLRLKALQQILSVYELLVRGVGRRICYHRLGRVRE